ncbi:MAG: aldose 1-epimerase family protein [Bacteroidota bacterium]|nr:aldose 1-epimerase family protein [Bacteroidota bacterium]MDX5430134.1 aldose 1-epimerase family protein [Bacteroidota bacterium]MDX5468895.1 aldose 1-epimerase family protein [Bacteroidota bacterium]
MLQLSNTETKLSIHAKGAELCSLVVEGKERLWTADTRWWNRHSPVLFPVVGKCQNNQIEVDGKSFPMNQHGFARDMEFQYDAAASNDKQACFRLFESGETLQRYPFPFELSITYTLLKKGVHVRYEVFNPGNRPLPFALGAHPGFLIPEGIFNHLNLRFSEEEIFDRHLLSEGLFNGQTRSLGSGKELAISSALFDLDAIVFKGVKSRKLELSSAAFHLTMEFGGFGDLGIWTKAGCQEFLCLEPWYGYAENQGENSDFYSREGIHTLDAGQRFEAFWQVQF